uniref:Uncharacterized protein n=1 Tax=Arundo donax TaxID=35708 RepID=A0A0A8ZGC2_ARUDO
MPCMDEADASFQSSRVPAKHHAAVLYKFYSRGRGDTRYSNCRGPSSSKDEEDEVR